MNQFIFQLFFLIVSNVLLNNYFLYKDYIFTDISSLNNENILNTTVINKYLRTNCCDDNVNNNIDNNFNNIDNNNIIRYYLRQI